MEKQDMLMIAGAVGLSILAGAMSNLELKVFNGDIGKEKVSLTRGFDAAQHALTKTLSQKETLTVSTTNNETIIFYGRPDGTLFSVDYTSTNGCTESYGRYTDKTKSYQSAFTNYQQKINHEIQRKEMEGGLN